MASVPCRKARCSSRAHHRWPLLFLTGRQEVSVQDNFPYCCGMQCTSFLSIHFWWYIGRVQIQLSLVKVHVPDFHPMSRGAWNQKSSPMPRISASIACIFGGVPARYHHVGLSGVCTIHLIKPISQILTPPVRQNRISLRTCRTKV